MTFGQLLPVLILFSSFFTGIAIFFLHEAQETARIVLNLIGASLKLAFVLALLLVVWEGEAIAMRLPLLPGADFVLQADSLSLQFVTLSAGLWLVTTVYAIGYLSHAREKSRFFGFFSLCVTASTGVALSGNLLTFAIFYEFLTLATYPLVVHSGSAAALRAGRIYLAYTLSGGIALFAGVVWLHTLGTGLEFGDNGVAALAAQEPGTAIAVFWVLILGLGVKAALVPLHGWLPVAMIAPAPVSALLHAVAVVKAGAFGIVRLLYDVYGIATAHALGVTDWLVAIAAVTIVWGSLRALSQDEIKGRLAYSTVSQLSYIALGAAIAGPLASIGALVHIVHQGVMKITLFFCAGILSERAGITRVSEIAGAGRRFPLTMAAFTVAALGMIGLPPLAGFISKWYLATGALEAGMGWVLAVLVASSVLNAAYFLPPIYAAWFQGHAGAEPPGAEGHVGLWLLLPPLFTAAVALGAGAFAGLPLSPLAWAELVVEREYFWFWAD